MAIQQQHSGAPLIPINYRYHSMRGIMYAKYLNAELKPNYPVPAIRETTGKINALNHQAWRWYWYKMGFNYGR